MVRFLALIRCKNILFQFQLLFACTCGDGWDACQNKRSGEKRAAQKHTKELFISSDTIKSFIELK